MRTFVSVLFALAVTLTSAAQQETPPARLEQAQLEAQLQRLAESSELPKSLASELEKLYQAAKTSLLEEKNAEQQRAELATRLALVPERERQVRLDLSQPAREPRLPDTSGLTLEEIEKRSKQAGQVAEDAREELRSVQKTVSRRTERLPRIPEQLQSLRSELDKLTQQLRPGVPLSPSFEVPAATRWGQRARAQELRATIALRQAEQRYFDSVAELLPLELDLAQRRVEFEGQLATLWQRALQDRRQRDSAAAADRARRRAEELERHPALQVIAQENLQLREKLAGRPDREGSGLTNAISAAEAAIREIQAAEAELEANRRSLLEKLRVAGPNRAVGLLMRAQYQRLPNAGDLERRRRDNLQLLEDTQYEHLLLRERGDALLEPRRELENLIEKSQASDATWDEDLRAAALELISERRGSMQQVLEAYLDYEEKLWSLQGELTRYVSATTEQRAFLQEYILWVRSVSGPLIPSGEMLTAGSRVLFDLPALGQALADPLRRGVAGSPSSYVLLLLFVLLCVLRPVLRRRQATLGERVSKARSDRFLYSIAGLVYACVIAARVPAALALSALYLRYPLAPSAEAAGLARTLLSLAGMLLPILLLREISRPGGFGETHFRWRKSACAAMHARIGRVLPFLVLGSYVSDYLEAVESGPGHESIGRIAGIVFLLAWAWFLHGIFRKESRILGAYYQRRPHSLLSRGRRVWWLLAVGIPAFLALLSVLGFQYTSTLITRRLLATLFLALLWLLFHALILRWLFVAKRSNALAQAKTAGAERDAEEAGLDLVTLDAQSRRLFGTALFLSMLFAIFSIWSDVIPALGVLDQVELYPRFLHVIEEGFDQSVESPKVESGEEAAAPGAGSAVTMPFPGLGSPAGGSEGDVMPGQLTLADLGTSLLILMLTILMVRNIPALLEILLLRRLPLDPGARFAITTVTRYVLVVFGVSLALSSLGIGWTKLQWLIAALTFGLAFGLQEIFANLVSGLIILFEQPVRVGDIVTVGDVDGEVTKIRMRATTITNFERKEYLVPNKEFITGKLVNWTLSDAITRMTVRVGIAYGSDTHLATRTLLTIAREYPLVLENPRPRALFMGFGDSTLNFELRVFFENFSNWPKMVHDMHTLVNDRFNESGIEIAFPQRDLHLRSVDALPEGISLERFGGSRDQGGS